jgi:Asp-tRNA(Asn)/Glu-tRNA(Gln) amidotransferase A subunit family amidase
MRTLIRLSVTPVKALRLSHPPAAELTAGRGAHGIVQGFEAWHALAGDYDQFADRMSEILVQTLKDGSAITPEEYDDARRLARAARRRTNALFDEVDILLTPSAPGTAPAGLGSTGSPVFNKLWTLTGSPCVNVPGIVDASGLPLGMQVVARFGQDQLALSAAAWLEGLAGQVLKR